MIPDDCPVKYLTNAALERISAGWRESLRDFFLTNTLDVISLFCRARALLKRPVEVIVKSDLEMGRANAYVSADRTKVFVRSSLVEGCNDGRAESIFDAVHELAHLVLHPQGQPLARMVDGNIKVNYLAAEESAERQANYFTRAFLMTHREVRTYATAEALSQECFVTLRQAGLRLNEFAHLPDNKPGIVDEAWSMARQSDQHDPIEFRLSRGNFLAERGQYHKPSHHYGWFIDHGSVVTYIEHQTD